MYNGVFNIYKEAGFTSHDVVAKMRGILGQKKIGHTGTLDPDAVGVLPVCAGNATGLCDMLTDKEKEYVALMRLGIVTDTQDLSGTVLSEREVSLTDDEVREAVMSFAGEYAQLPPMYSAVKVDGKRLYELARRGLEVERKPRNVVIHEIEILDIKQPEVTMRVRCGKGTYIRTLCHDIGKSLGCGAAMASLKRTRSGCFEEESAITLSQLESLKDDGRLEEALIPVEKILEDYAEVHVIPPCEKLLQNGNSIFLNQIRERMMFGDGELVRAYGGDRFYGVYFFEEQSGKFKPRHMFL